MTTILVLLAESAQEGMPILHVLLIFSAAKMSILLHPVTRYYLSTCRGS